MKEFPFGGCGAATYLIGTYLEDIGFGKFSYIEGKKRNIQSHAWAQQGNLIIDLTAGQFPSAPEPFIVPTSSLWHKDFKIIESHDIDLSVNDNGVAMPLRPFYKELHSIVRSA